MTVEPVFGIGWPDQDYDDKDEVTGLKALEGILANLHFEDGVKPEDISIRFKGWANADK